MIKIKPYTEKRNCQEILGLYLYMISASTPFYPEDVFGEKQFFWKDKWKAVKDLPKKPACYRTSKYVCILKEYGIYETGKETETEKLDNDAILAKCIIKAYSKKLFDFLYEGIREESAHVNSQNLRTLLTAKMDDEFWKGRKFRGSDEKGKHLSAYVFQYEKFSDMKKEMYQLVRWLGVEVCPYCNRAFTTTLQRDTKGKKMSVRAEIDHYKNKSAYPYLALSLLNMVPSCSVCNRIKHDTRKPVLYPYSEEMGEAYVFETRPAKGVLYLTGVAGGSEEFDIVGKRSKGMSADFSKRLDHSLEIFRIEELYQSHKQYVVDLFFQRYIFGESELKALCDRFPELFHSVDEAKKMLYLMDIRKESWGKRPLAKLTHDIDEEISRLIR